MGAGTLCRVLSPSLDSLASETLAAASLLLRQLLAVLGLTVTACVAALYPSPGGATESELLEDYPNLTPEDLRAAMAYGAASVAHEEVVLLADASDRGKS